MPSTSTTEKEVQSKLEEKQVKKAVQALLTHLAKQTDQNQKKPNLLDEQDSKYLWLTITTKKIPMKASLKPHTILLPHSILPPSPEICLITKDPQREFKDLIAAQGLQSTISKVIGVSKLKARYKPYEAKRQLCASYDLFLADERVLPLLPPILGKTFFLKKKQPVPVNLKKKDVKSEIEQTLHSTFLFETKGACMAIKIGTTRLSAEENVANIMGSIESIIKRIPKKWANILSIHLKASESIALPLYATLPDGPVEAHEKKKEDAEKVVAKKEVIEVKSAMKKAAKTETETTEKKKTTKIDESSKDTVVGKKAASALKTKKNKKIKTSAQ